MEKCKIMCEMEREGEYICCYYCGYKDDCNSCNEKPWNCSNKLEINNSNKVNQKSKIE